MVGTQEEAAEAYDIAAIKFRGANAVTNFDISRYDVERIMASNTLLAGELARRNREPEICNQAFNHTRPMVNCLGDIFLQERNGQEDERTHDYEPQQLRIDVPLGTNIVSGGNLDCTAAEDSGKIGMRSSNPSSLVTSLSSSREGSPERSLVPMSFGIVPPGSNLGKLSYASEVQKSSSSWIPASQIRPGVAMPHVPVFTSWTDL